MDMAEIFLELIFSVALSVAVCYMVMKLQSRGEEEKIETCMESNHGDGSGKEEDKQLLVYDIGKSKTDYPFSDFSDFFDQFTIENLFDNDVLCSNELTSEVVEDNCFCDDNSNEVISELVEVESAKSVQDRLERWNFYKIEGESSEDIEVIEAKCIDGNEKEGLFDDDDWEWEGIERTELEKVFGAAVAFVGCKKNAGLINKELKIELYGFHKIAIQGPCHGSQPPMAFKLSARAKWNSWRRLGNMKREFAMEQYLILLSKTIPEWNDQQSQFG